MVVKEGQVVQRPNEKRTNNDHKTLQRKLKIDQYELD